MGKGNWKRQLIHLQCQDRVYLFRVWMRTQPVTYFADSQLGDICCELLGPITGTDWVTQIVVVVDGLVDETNFCTTEFQQQPIWGWDWHPRCQSLLLWVVKGFICTQFHFRNWYTGWNKLQAIYFMLPRGATFGLICGELWSKNWIEICMYIKTFSWLKYCWYDVFGMCMHFNYGAKNVFIWSLFACLLSFLWFEQLSSWCNCVQTFHLPTFCQLFGLLIGDTITLIRWVSSTWWFNCSLDDIGVCHPCKS